jgi:hypothetical protein
MKIFLRTIVVIYWIAACGYLLHSMLTHTGLCGWLIAWQFTHFHIAYDNVTIGGAMLILVAPTWPFWALTRDPHPDRGAAPPPKKLTFGGVLMMACVPLLLAGVAYGYLQYVAHQPKQAERGLHIDQVSSWSEADAGPVRLQGTWRGDYLYVVSEVDDANRPDNARQKTAFVPITPASWKAGQPVACVVSTTFDGYMDPQTRQWTVLPRAPLPVTFRGELRREAVPPYVKTELQSTTSPLPSRTGCWCATTTSTQQARRCRPWRSATRWCWCWAPPSAQRCSLASQPACCCARPWARTEGP